MSQPSSPTRTTQYPATFGAESKGLSHGHSLSSFSRMTDAAWRCPQCGLFNVRTAERCDCGYVRGETVVPPPLVSPALRKHVITTALVAVILAGLLSIGPKAADGAQMIYLATIVPLVLSLTVMVLGPARVFERVTTLAFGMAAGSVIYLLAIDGPHAFFGEGPFLYYVFQGALIVWTVIVMLAATAVQYLVRPRTR